MIFCSSRGRPKKNAVGKNCNLLLISPNPRDLSLDWTQAQLNGMASKGDDDATMRWKEFDTGNGFLHLWLTRNRLIPPLAIPHFGPQNATPAVKILVIILSLWDCLSVWSFCCSWSGLWVELEILQRIGNFWTVLKLFHVFQFHSGVSWWMNEKVSA